MADAVPPPPRRPARKAQTKAKWTRKFLEALAATSNVSAAARHAGVTTWIAYAARRGDAEFNQRWHAALCEGYDNLKLDLLARLRSGELKPAAGAKRAVRSYDNATALRLLIAHRETVAQARAMRDNEDADSILAGINAKLERMRERQLAATRDDDDSEPA